MHITERKQFYKLTHQLEEVKCSKDFKIVIAEKMILELLSNLMCKFRFALVLVSARDATTKRNVTKSLPAVSTVLTRPFNRSLLPSAAMGPRTFGSAANEESAIIAPALDSACL